MSYALNRVYTEYYRSRGYDFDITNTTARDQAFVNGRSYFENISRLVDEMVGSYIRRVGSVEPLAAKFCNGTTSTCDGLSQWGSEALAREGLDSVEILKYYYGDDIEIVTNAPMEGVTESYPGTPLRLGSTGPAVTVVQTSLNRISQSYPAIPKINPVDGIYGPQTKAAVEAFQQIFALEPDGIVGRATWYQLVRVYVAVDEAGGIAVRGPAVPLHPGVPGVPLPGRPGRAGGAAAIHALGHQQLCPHGPAARADRRLRQRHALRRAELPGATPACR